ncbi:hypothetical protein NAEGRDRAFT_78874 [Naegleria gruberi]|uniref:Uncharacterized protein n=1 Tax=Naegleria gruberi TaxID=5762 RepID=D2V7B0_NAEGR|nr:uncharacterized protein NAEGRDRAFT_78874 [Naegleria gruberi]EFC47344.1 hypothetical protein NAEGRDRAFT_78874 [Naegleria gruberi]|eukprot:XP_002680088.1 hypothetical protein NAEGRDRAFT_78874 [Naegleria gruberi strain NEG-M]
MLQQRLQSSSSKSIWMRIKQSSASSLLLLLIVISYCCLQVNALDDNQFKTSPSFALRDVFQIDSSLNSSFIQLQDSIAAVSLAGNQEEELKNIFIDPNHHALSYYHKVLSEMDLLVYFHTNDYCAREYNLYAMSLLDSIVNTIEKVRAKHGKNFNLPDETLLTTRESKAVNLKVAQFNCLSSEYNGLLCDKILGDSWRNSCKQDLPSFFELSLGMKTSLNADRVKVMDEYVVNRLRFLPSKKRPETSLNGIANVIRVNKIGRQQDEDNKVQIRITADSTQEEILNENNEYIRKGLTIPHLVSDLKDSILQFLKSQYEFTEFDGDKESMLATRQFPRSYLFYEECDFKELFNQTNPTKKVRPMNLMLLHKGPADHEFPRTIISNYIEVTSALLREISAGLVYVCSGEAIKAFEATRDINGQGNFGTILVHNFLYGKRQSEIQDRGLLLFYNPVITNITSSEQLHLFRGEPYDAQFVKADSKALMKHINLMMKQTKAVNSFADWRDTNFFMLRGLTPLNEAIYHSIKTWLIKSVEQEQDLISIEKELIPFHNLIKEILTNSTILRDSRVVSKEYPSQLPDDNIEYSDKMIESCTIVDEYLTEMLASFNRAAQVTKKDFWSFINEKISQIQQELIKAKKTMGEECGKVCEELYSKLFVINSFKINEEQLMTL